MCTEIKSRTNKHTIVLSKHPQYETKTFSDHTTTAHVLLGHQTHSTTHSHAELSTEPYSLQSRSQCSISQNKTFHLCIIHTLASSDTTQDRHSHHHAASQSQPENSRLDAFVEREKPLLSDDPPEDMRGHGETEQSSLCNPHYCHSQPRPIVRPCTMICVRH